MNTETKHTPETVKLPFSPDALKLYRWIISDNDEEIAKGDLNRTKHGREVFLLAKDVQLVLNESDMAKELAQLRADNKDLLGVIRAVVTHANNRQSAATHGLQDPELGRLPEPEFVAMARTLIVKHTKV